MVVPRSVGSYRPVIAGAKLREGTTTILPRGRALQGVGLSSMVTSSRVSSKADPIDRNSYE